MSEYFRTTCTYCGGTIEAPKSAAGMTLECPHCHAQTSVRKSNQWIWIVLALVLVAAIAGVTVKLVSRRATVPSDPIRNVSSTDKSISSPKSPQDLKAGAVEIDQPKGSGLRYAVGTLRNDSDHSRYGVGVEIILLDQSGRELPTRASDYVQMLEPRKEWRFRALVLDSKAASAKIASIREEE